jgi:hypothetical protein
VKERRNSHVDDSDPGAWIHHVWVSPTERAINGVDCFASDAITATVRMAAAVIDTVRDMVLVTMVITAVEWVMGRDAVWE